MKQDKNVLNQKPREKIQYSGAEHMTDYELLAILLRTGNKKQSATELSQSILSKYGTFSSLLNVKAEELKIFEGIGTAKACSILAALEISKRILYPVSLESIKIKAPRDVFKLVGKELGFDLSEKLILISLDSRGKTISKDLISQGTITETIINPREIFQRALSRNASSIILAHNHPSGDTTPSTEDIKTTEEVSETGKKLGIPLLDHIIITKNDFLSLRQIGLIGKTDGKNKGGD